MSLIEIIVFLPLLAALAVGLGSPARVTALGTSVVVLLLTLFTAFRFQTDVEGAFQFESSRTLLETSGFPKLSLAFGLDGMSLVLLLLSAIVMVAAMMISPKESEIKGSARLYFVSLLLIAGGAIGAFCSTDLFFLYAFHELALIPTFLMIGIFGHGENRVRTAWTITIFLGVGSLILLVGLIIGISALEGTTFDIASLITAAKTPGTAIAADTQSWVFLLLFIGFGILVSLFPFHSWAAPAYAEAPTPVAMLHAGVLKKFGLYGLIRIALPFAPAGAEKWLNLMLILLLGNILYIGFVTIAQKKLDKMLGYSSVMHMGYAFLGIAAGNQLGLSGAVLLMFAHGISIALLFALSGWMRDQFGTLDFGKLGGIAKSLPKLGLIFGFGVFASIGLPGFANFAAEVEIFFGAFTGAEQAMTWIRWATIGGLWGVVISAVYMLRAYRHIFLGPKPEKLATPADLDWSVRLPLLILLVTLLAVGFVPELLNQYIRPAINGIFLIKAG